MMLRVYCEPAKVGHQVVWLCLLTAQASQFTELRQEQGLELVFGEAGKRCHAPSSLARETPESSSVKNHDLVIDVHI